MNPIRTNKPVFFGDDGEVLKSGNIYIGQPNQWPLSFPKTVTLQDSAGSQFTAQQPLVTNNQGRIEYNGKAAIALVDGDYSMLVRDRNGVTVADGYTPFVENTDGGGGAADGVTQVGLLLSDIKQFNVTPGETVRNVGKTTVLDGLGVEWLVVSNTGNPADDVDLIDFANGTQGERIEDFLYVDSVAPSIADKSFNPGSPTEVWTGSSTSVLLGALSETGPGFYVLYASPLSNPADAAGHYFIFLVDTTEASHGAANFSYSTNTLFLHAARYTGTSFVLDRWQIGPTDLTSGSLSALTIDEIHKV